MKFFRQLHETTLERAGYFLIRLFFLCQVFLIFFLDIRKLLLFNPDDAAYYFKIVENLHNGLGFSFDGIHQTNGYQPLWLYLLCFLRLFLNFPPEFLYRVYLLVQVLLLGGAMLLLDNVLRRLFGKRITLFSLGIFLLVLFFQAFNGMETALLIFMITVLFYTGSKANFLHSCDEFTSMFPGVLLGLLFLTRLDMLFFILALYPLLLTVPAINTRELVYYLKKILWLSIGIGLVTIPYLGYNYFTFGNIQPVSGLLKSNFPHPGLNLHFAFKFLDYLTIFPAVIGAIAYFIWFRKQRRSGISISSALKYYRGFLFLTASSIILHFLYYILFTHWEHINWHFYYYNCFLVLLITEPLVKLFAGASNSRKNIISVLFGLAILGILISKTVSRVSVPIDKNWHSIAWEAASWAKANTSPNTVFAMVDAGNFSFFSQRKVINLDGLVNDFAFQDTLNNRALNEYLRKNNVSYLIIADTTGKFSYDHKDKNTYSVSFESHFYHSFSDPIKLTSDAVVAEYSWRNAEGPTKFMIWKINPASQ